MMRVAAFALVVLAGSALSACRSAPVQQTSPIVQPGTPGSETRVLDSKSVDMSRPKFTPADVKFMQGMIGHHTQAIEMVELLKTRTNDSGMKQLAKRIEVSQNDEIKWMQHWLEDRGQEVPGPHAMHMHGATLMPGMLSAEEMETLAAAKGVEFDRRFLTGMIKHHGGALTMVAELFATPGAGQEPEMYAFASDVDADQRMEINRMSNMLKERKQ